MKTCRVDELEAEKVLQGVTRKILMYSDRMMIVYYEIEPDTVFPEHSHPHEQMGFLLKGQFEITTENEKKAVKSGTAYFFPPNEKHKIKTIGKGKSIAIDIFHPPREDFLRK